MMFEIAKMTYKFGGDVKQQNISRWNDNIWWGTSPRVEHKL